MTSSRRAVACCAKDIPMTANHSLATDEPGSSRMTLSSIRVSSVLIRGFFILALLAGSAYGETHTFTIDPAHTTVQFEIRHFFGKVVGQFHDVRGTLEIDVDHPENSTVTARCPSRTVDT